MTTHYDTINTIIAWYAGQKAFDPTRQNIEALLKARRKLVGAMAELGKDVAGFKADAEMAYYNRKAAIVRVKSVNRAEGMTVSDAEDAAIKGTKQESHLEIAANQQYLESRNLFETVRETMNALATEIRILEEEYKRANYQPDNR